MSTEEFRIRVASWNILADRCLGNHPYVSYEEGERRQLQREVLERLMDQKYDFICLQEVDTGYIEEEVLEGKYKVLATHWGLAPCICFREKRWRLVGEKQVVKMDDLAALKRDKRNRLTMQGSPSQFGHDFLKGKYGIMARFVHKKTGQELVVVNTHLTWQPDLEFVKLCQIHYLMTKLEEFTKQTDDEIIFCGDLNSLPGSKLVRYLGAGYFYFRCIESEIEESDDYKLEAMKWLLEGAGCPFEFTSAYSEDHPLTTMTPDFKGCIDYIFFRSTYSTCSRYEPDSRLRLKGTLKLTTARELKKKYKSEFLPNSTWPSDHLLLGAEFAYIFSTSSDDDSSSYE